MATKGDNAMPMAVVVSGSMGNNNLVRLRNNIRITVE